MFQDYDLEIREFVLSVYVVVAGFAVSILSLWDILLLSFLSIFVLVLLLLLLLLLFSYYLFVLPLF